MDLILAHGYFLAHDARERRTMRPYPPLGLLSLSAYLRARGFQVTVFDSTFSSLREFVRLLESTTCRTLGLYCNLQTRPTVLRMIRLARRRGFRILLGGPEPFPYAEEFLRRGADVVVNGEGETALEELVPELRNGTPKLEQIAGIAYRDGAGAVLRTAARPLIDDLDGLPIPDREAIAMQPYLDAWRRAHGAGSVSLVTMRGCPFHCAWCSRSVFGETYRRRSPERVVEEIAAIRERYRPERLWFADDVFTIQHKWVQRLAAGLSNAGLRVPFECITRADRLTEDVVRLLKEMGCHRMWIGAESGSQRILDAMDRGVRVEQTAQVAEWGRKHGVRTGYFIMFGYPGETRQDIEATAGLLRRAQPDCYLSTVAYPIRGTPYYERVRDLIRAPGSWAHSTDRDLKIGRRPPKIYYRAAALHAYGEYRMGSGHGNWKHRAASAAGRLGMTVAGRIRG